MKKQFFAVRKLHIPLKWTVITLDASWLIVIPVGLWAIGAVYVPIFGAFLNPIETWSLTIIIAVLSGVCLVGHAWAHIGIAGLTKSDIPTPIPLYPLGDAAQVWPAATTARREALVALAGPGINLLLAVLAYLVWNMQIAPYPNTIMLFLVFFNGGLAVVNLAPIFPLDGGRLVRAIVWSLLARPALAARLGKPVSLMFAAILTAWGVFLIAQQARFSWFNGVGTMLFAGLLLLPLLTQPDWQWNRAEPSAPAAWSTVLIRGPAAGLLILTLLSLTISLVPTNHGLEAPGVAPDVGPMIEAPAEYRHPAAGRFLLTTVISQTPITVGQWIMGQVSPAIRLVSPERIVPVEKTVQEVALQNFQMLDDSQLAAIAVGLQQAGYEVEIKGLGARVLSVLGASPAYAVLQPGDVIVGLNDTPIETTAALINRLTAQEAQDIIQLQIKRNDEPLTVSVPLMPPPEPELPPRIGITVEDAGFESELPFPVQINPQKIVGGPSAGLMFTLAVYNLVTPEDLTGGRVIAGTGAITLDGVVGPIGGVQQKVAAAEFAGAEYFLSPPENYEDAQAVARRITVVEVGSAEEAIRFLESLPPP